MVVADPLLLELFRRQGDAAAFEAILRRHGPLVLGVCQRILADRHAAEDAFQATFLVLAQSAASVRRPEAVAAWLYAVARRIAMRLKVRQRHRRETLTPNVPDVAPAATDPVARVVWLELRGVIDEERDRLPEKYRAPLVLCYLDGQGQAEAARALGWPVTSLARRLERARELLRTRLAGRGVSLPAALLFATLAQQCRASVPLAVLPPTARAAALLVVGQKAIPGGVAASVVALAEGVMRSMFWTKVKTAAAFLLALTLLGLGVGMAAHHGQDKPSPAEPPPPRPAARSSSGTGRRGKRRDALPATPTV